MFSNYKSNILLTFLKPAEKGVKKVRVTLANIRTDITPAEILQVANAFSSLVTYPLDEVEMLQYSYVIKV